jgi:hypothetical protein
MHFPQEKTFLGEIIPISVITVFVLMFFHEMIFFSKIPLFRDLGPFFYPMRFSLAQSLRAGELPLWDSHIATGFPLLANFQSGTFYPPNLAYLIFPFLSAVKVVFLFHSLVAALGTYFLLRHWGFLQSIALIGSILFTFGGCTISLINLLNHFQTAVWLPWLLLLGEEQIVSADRSKIFTFALIAALQFLAGSPEIYAMSMAVLLLNNLRIKSEGKTSYGQIFSSLLIGNLLVAGLAMVQILPTWELVRETSRYTTPSLQWATEWSLHPVSLLNLIFLDREVDVSSFDRFQSFFARHSPLLMSLYMGVLFPFGLWVWILEENRPRKVILLAGIGLSLLVSMGSYTRLYQFFYDYVPLVPLGRFPEKIFFITFVLLLYLTLQGLNTLVFQPPGSKTTKILLGPAVLCAIFVGFYTLFRAFRGNLMQFVASPKGISSDLPLTLEIYSGVLLHLERQIALLLGLGAVFFIWQKGRLRKSILQILIVGIVYTDLYSAHRSYLFLTDENVLTHKPRLLGFLRDYPSYRVFFISPQSPIHPIMVLFPKAKSPAEHSSFSFEALRPNTGIFWGINYMQDIDALLRESYDDFRLLAKNLSPDGLYRLLGNLNVKYLISLQELSSSAIAQIGYFPEQPLWLYRIEHVTPRAHIVPTAVSEKEPRKVIELLAASGFDPFREVILDESVQLPSRENFAAEAKILTDAKTRVALAVSLNSTGILVLADSFYPGWKVYVDGVEGRIMRANYFFRGVLLPSGNHQVIFKYEPASLRYGAVVTLITIAIFLFSLVIWVARRITRAGPG